MGVGQEFVGVRNVCKKMTPGVYVYCPYSGVMLEEIPWIW